MRTQVWAMSCVVTAFAFASTGFAQTPQEQAAAYAQATTLAKGIAESVTNGDGSAIADAFDNARFGDIVLAGLNVNSAQMAGFRAGLAGTGKSLASNFKSAIKKGDQYRFLRIRGTPGHLTALFRVELESGINYHELHLERDPAGRMKIVDIDLMSTGEAMSSTAHRLILMSLPPSGLSRLLGRDSEMVAHRDDVMSLINLTKAQKGAEVLTAYDALPESLKNEKLFALMRVMGAVRVGGAAYPEAIAEYLKKFPNDSVRCLSP